MYLYAEKFLSGYPHRGQANREHLESVLKLAGFPKSALSKGAPFANVSVSVAYWRKANAIHGWFVNTLANGVDECQKIEVPREELERLRDICATILNADESNREAVASEYLPPTEGFFFGSYEYDEWYWKDLADTHAELKRILASKSLADCDFTYQASW
jgi:hypothetical protein